MENTDKNTIKNITTIRSKHDKRINVASMTDAQFDDMIRDAFNKYPETLNHLNDTTQAPEVKYHNHWEDTYGRNVGLAIALFIFGVLGVMVISVAILIIFLLLNLF